VRTLLGCDNRPPDVGELPVATVEFGNGKGPVEGPTMVPIGPVLESGLVADSPAEAVSEFASVEKFGPFVRVPLGVAELKLIEVLIGGTDVSPEPELLRGAVELGVGVVELVNANGPVWEAPLVGKPDGKTFDELIGLGGLDDAMVPGTRPVEYPSVPVAVVPAGDELDSERPDADRIDDAGPVIVPDGEPEKGPVGLEGEPVPTIVPVSLFPGTVELPMGKGALNEPLGLDVDGNVDGPGVVSGAVFGKDSVLVVKTPVPLGMLVPLSAGEVELPIV